MAKLQTTYCFFDEDGEMSGEVLIRTMDRLVEMGLKPSISTWSGSGGYPELLIEGDRSKIELFIRSIMFEDCQDDDMSIQDTIDSIEGDE